MNENKHRTFGNIIVALILATGLVLAAAIGVNGIKQVKGNDTSIVVTGSAKQQITSDLIVWTGYFHCKNAVITDAYSNLEDSRAKVTDYLMNLGIKEDEMVFSSITTSTYYVYNEYGNCTNDIDYYDLSQTVTITSKEIDKVTQLSRNVTELLNEGIQFDSYSPQYLYTQLADKKVAMLAEATKDATKRAQMIAENAGSTLGDLTYADMGVMQITPLYSNEISDYGMSDTSSLEKEITAVVHCTFTIKK